MNPADVSRPRHTTRYRIPGRPGRQSGAIAIMFVGALIVIICFFGLAIDLSRLYNRKIELQNVADTVALAAALELNGSDAGITAALDKAADRFVASATGALTYQYGTRNMILPDDALQFGATPSGPWKKATEAQGQAAGLMYARFSTAKLDASYGEVETIFAHFFTGLRLASTGAAATAGRSSLKIIPLGICAMRPSDARRDHKGELEEYGFRRGIAYDLMQLNPESASEGQTFRIHPQADTSGEPTTEELAPYVCSGTIDMARVTGGKIGVSTGFPLDALYHHLNSRFDLYNAPLAACKPSYAPPDVNIKQYSVLVTGGVPWMNPVPEAQAAALSETEGKRWTVAGPDSTPSGTTASMFGPLWSHAKAAKYSSAAEPASGYSTYGTGDWATLYTPSAPPPPKAVTTTSSAYPTKASEPTPYLSTSSTFSKKPSRPGVRGRRVLNVPLLACPVSGSSASVLGIGKFFMTVQATDKKLIAEFGGLASEDALGTRVELYP